MPDVFVNPYTFVPFPEPEPQRAERVGHHQMESGHLSGKLEVRFRTRSSLLVRNVYEGAGDDSGRGTFPRRKVPGRDVEVPYVPGSSVAGAVRSLHEVLAGGCLRVFDDDFLPAYRDNARAHTGWLLARVMKVDRDGVPVEAAIDRAEPVWVSHDAVKDSAIGPHAVAGEPVTIVEDGITEDRKGKYRVKSAEHLRSAERGNIWFLAVNDVLAREGKIWWAAGRITQPEPVVVDLSGWARFRAAAHGTDDMRQWRAGRLQVMGAPDVPVTHQDGSDLGFRYPNLDRLTKGQVVWVKLERDGGQEPVRIKEIKLAQVWRHPAEPKSGSSGERIPPGFRACSDPQHLCPSCRLFGSADTEGADVSGRADQLSYRGHVRFGDAVPVDAGAGSRLRVETLPPLGAPRAGAGQFYLDRSRPDGARAEKGKPDLREWGSAADLPGRRNLRGRKRYWLTGDPAVFPLDRRPYVRATKDGTKGRKGGNREVFAEQVFPDNDLVSRAESLPREVDLSCTVVFDNVSPAQLGGLLVALDPSLLLDRGPQDRAVGNALGGGRPLGFGSVTATVTIGTVQDADARYLGDAEHCPPSDLTGYVAAFRGEHTRLESYWRRIAAVLRLDHVAPHQVWYPPAGALPEPGTGALGAHQAKNLRPSFEFWGRSRGSDVKESGHGFVGLPAVDKDDQGIAVVVDDKQLKLGRKTPGEKNSR